MEYQSLFLVDIYGKYFEIASEKNIMTGTTTVIEITILSDTKIINKFENWLVSKIKIIKKYNLMDKK